MTREEIENMPAGFEMDSLIISRILKPDIGLMSARGFHPSRNIQHTWDVVEKMKDDGWFFQLFDVVELPEWMARFTDVPGVGVVMKDARGYADTVPLAICRAALIAVMEAK